MPRQNSQKSPSTIAHTDTTPPNAPQAAPSAKPSRRPNRAMMNAASTVTTAAPTVISANGSVASALSGAS
nr:hypothetical protein [Devosia insulae]